jgi:DNA repair exonuclease SbcCD ATPase subunit
MELNKLVAAKEWCKWRALIEERLSKDYSDLIKKLESDISALQEESSRSDTLKQKHASELTKLKKIESFQHDIVEQQDMVTLFQQRVGKVHKHVAQTKEDISYSAAMKQDLESKIDTYDETIEKKEILSKELSSIQDVYEISKQFNSWCIYSDHMFHTIVM